MSDFIKIKVYAERTAFGPLGRPYTTTTNEVEEIIVPVSRIVQVIPKNEIKCLVDIDTIDGVDTRWCVMSADEVMALLSVVKTHDDDTCPHLVVAGRLEAENARLKAEVERWKEIATVYNKDHDLECANQLLDKQVERLTKAGDAMADAIDKTLDNPYDLPPYSLDKSLEAWHAAKEGKQP